MITANKINMYRVTHISILSSCVYFDKSRLLLGSDWLTAPEREQTANRSIGGGICHSLVSTMLLNRAFQGVQLTVLKSPQNCQNYKYLT